jgi:hypothetical protein
MIRKHAPTPLRQQVPGVPPALDAVVMRLLSKEPGQRFENAKALLSSLVSNRLMD